MKLVPIALYIGDLPGAPLDGRIRRRYRKKALSSQVDCIVEPKGTAFVATPIFRPTVPQRARFRLQLRVPLLSGLPDDGYALVIQPVNETRSTDPEQTIFAPIYAGPDRLIFEFTRAEVIWCTADGTSGVRFAAIDPSSGQIGTHDRAARDQYANVLSRCRGQLTGDAMLFPPREDLRRPAWRIPNGLPVLQFQ